MAAIRTMYPNAPDPVFTTRSQWYNDPFSLGSYSFNAVGVNPSTDFSNVIGPFNGGRWVFAGEHTSQTYFGTMTGAYMTGQSSVSKVSLGLRCTTLVASMLTSTCRHPCTSFFFLSFNRLTSFFISRNDNELHYTACQWCDIEGSSRPGSQ